MKHSKQKKLEAAIRKNLPLSLRKALYFFLNFNTEYPNWRLKRKILAYLRENELFSQKCDCEKNEIYLFLKNNGLSFFPYEFIKNYNQNSISVYFDIDCDMYYVLHENKRLYFKTNWTEEQVKEYYNSLLIEQDIDSPHRYEYGTFRVNNDIVADIGAAEGIFALSVVERAKKIYLFEADASWIPVLEKTFEPWSNKVVIVNKFVSNTNTDNTICLDEYFSVEKVSFLKADVEGSEIQLLQGVQKLLSQGGLKLAICTYHGQNDSELINDFLIQKGYLTEFSKGYMLFLADKNLSAPWLRKALIRGTSRFIQTK